MNPQENFYQVTLNSDPTSSTAYNDSLSALQAFLDQCSTQYGSTKYRKSASIYPFYIPPHRISELELLQLSLHTAVTGIIKNWWSTPRYQHAIPTSPKIERVLRALDLRRPYKDVGSWRPDFLIPEESEKSVAICEINARFAFNVFFAGEYIQQYVQKLDFVETQQQFKSTTKEKSIISYYSELFDMSKPLALLKGREDSGLDIRLAQDFLRNSRFVHPRNLRLLPCTSSPSGYTLSDDVGPISQIALELHQDELESFDENMLLEIGACCHNDLRTVFFMHDKRMLGLVLQELENLVSTAVLTIRQAQALRAGIVETHIPGSLAFREIMEQPESRHLWLLKPCQFGKGEGIVFGKDVDHETWTAISQPTSEKSGPEYSPSSAPIPYVIQRYFAQRRHNLVVGPESEDQPPRHVSWLVVGTITCINSRYLGLGAWRTSPTDITAVSRGGMYMGGITLDAGLGIDSRPSSSPSPPLGTPSSNHLEVPETARVRLNSADLLSDEIHSIRSALKNHGFAVVHLGFSDPSSTSMFKLAQSLGQTVDHSKTNDPIWDVKPKTGADLGHLARSQTSNSFPWHTDCSFETSPPRYFALHIIHADRFGGGKLRVLPVGDILDTLSSSTLQTLKQPLFRMNVPKEFHKDVTHLTGALVTSDGKIRYRREIIEPLDKQAKEALDELENALRRSEQNGWAKVLGPDVMTDGVVVCLDNAKFMHARSEVKDPQRWLRRVRWGPEMF
ncbi:hypothetical protein RUND412_010138 [Rhizina undulata]